MNQKAIPLHVKILSGMFLGTVFGFLAIWLGLGSFVTVWIKPFGTIFINLLKLIAVPLILVSLISGVSSLKDTASFKRIGSRTIIIYISTTLVAVLLGLGMVNLVKPGKYFSVEKREQMKEKYGAKVNAKTTAAEEQIKSKETPLQFLIDIVPINIFKSASDNTQMLPVIFFAILFGISIILSPNGSTSSIRTFFVEVNTVVLKMIDLIMEFAPFGVFALLSGLIIDFAGDSISDAISLFRALGIYSLTVILSLFIMVYGIYGLLYKVLTGKSPKSFFKSIVPVQMLAFSTSSSAATLPLTMEHCEKELGISHEVVSFVLPVGATVNMDGTSLYQTVATVFIAEALGIDLTYSDQLTIVFTALLASIGSAAVPGAGMVMLVIVLNSVGIPIEGISLIFAVDRILDMFRTTVNVTGDMVVSSIIQEFESKK
jgi:proton glutamate symport protein